MEDILSKVQEILNDPKKLDEFKNIASAILNNSEGNQSEKKEEDIKNNPMNNLSDILNSFGNSDSNGNNKENENFNFPFDMDMILKIQNAVSILNQDDNSINFLKSLRLLLGDSKQKKVDEAIKIIKLIKLAPLVKDFKLI